jgi:hypothetical protein
MDRGALVRMGRSSEWVVRQTGSFVRLGRSSDWGERNLGEATVDHAKLARGGD